jgi:hypothetical protein
MSQTDKDWPDVDVVHLGRMNTPAGQSVVAFYAGLGGTWSLPEEGLGVIERAAAGDADARAMALRGAAVLGASPLAIELVIEALAEAKETTTDEEPEVTLPTLLAFLVPRLAGAFYPGIDLERFLRALLNTRNLEFYLLNRVNGEEQQRPAEGDAGSLYDYAVAASLLPEDKVGERPLRWVSEQQALWLEQALKADQGHHVSE